MFNNIEAIDPIKNSSDTRWYLSIQDLDRIGQFFVTGIYPNYKYLSVGGNSAHNQGIYKVIIGSPISYFQDVSENENNRIIHCKYQKVRRPSHNIMASRSIFDEKRRDLYTYFRKII